MDPKCADCPMNLGHCVCDGAYNCWKIANEQLEKVMNNEN